ncbi:MAG: MBL fold metallo-hydrolase [Flavobacteriales bacterium]|nr:MBL fold metallo-hydrolase [Flavobacteriales bacterium]
MPRISIEFLGTGTSQGVPVVACDCAVCRSDDPRDRRLRTSALVRVEGTTVLIDAGPDLRQQMLRARVHTLDAVLLTHEHMDHIAGMDDLRAFNFSQRRAMDIHGDAATLEAVRRVYHYAFSHDRYPGVPEFNLHEITPGREIDAAGVRVTPVQVMHYRMPVMAFRIGGLAYVTDAKTIAPEEKDKLRGADVLVLNALRRKEHISHLDLDAAIGLARELSARRTYFTHISHLMGRHAEVERLIPEGMALAHDGLVVELG